MNRESTQFFIMSREKLLFDYESGVLLCKSKDEPEEKRWAKKLPDVVAVDTILEDAEKFYVACENSETDGIFLALSRDDGRTLWYIPGKSLMHLLYDGFLYLIFIDEFRRYYLIKAELGEGRKVWHHEVDEDLAEYTFSRTGIRLVYRSGREESLSIKTGERQY